MKGLLYQHIKMAATGGVTGLPVWEYVSFISDNKGQPPNMGKNSSRDFWLKQVAHQTVTIWGGLHIPLHKCFSDNA